MLSTTYKKSLTRQEMEGTDPSSVKGPSVTICPETELLVVGFRRLLETVRTQNSTVHTAAEIRMRRRNSQPGAQ